MKYKKLAATVLAGVGVMAAIGMPAAEAKQIPRPWTLDGRGVNAVPPAEKSPLVQRRLHTTPDEIDGVPVRRPHEPSNLGGRTK